MILLMDMVSQKVKCKVCGLKGFYYFDNVISEFWASRFLYVHKFVKGKQKSYFICRTCVTAVLDGLRFESCRIDDLYKPKIKEKNKK